MLKITKDEATLWYRRMLLLRRFEEKCAELYNATKIRGFLHLYIGEEAVATGLIPFLKPEDAIVATNRKHAHALLRGVPARAIMAEMFGKVTGCCKGRGARCTSLTNLPVSMGAMRLWPAACLWQSASRWLTRCKTARQ